MDLLDEFWRWLAFTPEEYIKKIENCCVPNNIEEFLFPHWGKLLKQAEASILNDCLDDSAVDNVLIVMALDNENEDILDYIVDNASPMYIKKIVLKGMHTPFSHARWQIAEILGRRKPLGWKDHLLMLCADKNHYVAKRAYNVLNNTSNSQIPKDREID